MDSLERKAVQIWKVFPPILIIFGTFGNFLTIIVLTHRKNRNTSTSIFLTALAVSDLLVLWTGLLRQWIMYMFGIDIRANSDLGCKIHLFVVYGSFLCSSWFLVAVTIERFVSVWFPHKVKATCSMRNACFVIIFIVFTFALYNAHWFYGVVVRTQQLNVTQKSTCGFVSDGYKGFFVYYEWIYLCLFSLIPLIILTAANVLIVTRLVIRKFKTRIQVEPSNVAVPERRNQVSQLTVMLLTVNTVFILCTPPISIYNIWEDHWKSTAKTNHEEAALKLVWAIVNMLAYLNTTLNFFLYFLSGTKFRKQVKDLFCRRRNGEMTSFTQPTNDAKAASR